MKLKIVYVFSLFFIVFSTMGAGLKNSTYKYGLFIQYDQNIVKFILALFLLILLLTNIILLVNIKRRKIAEKAQGESEERLRTLINGMPDFVLFKDEAGKWMEINDSLIKMFKLGRTDYKGKSDAELAEYKPALKELIEKLVVYDEQAWISKSNVNFEEFIMTADGSRRLMDFTTVPLFHADGSRKGIMVLGRDITDRKHTKDALQKNEEVLRATLNATADGIMVVTNDRKVFDFNPLFQRMWRIPQSLICTFDERLLLDYVSTQLEKPEVFREWVEECYNVYKTDSFTVYFKDGRIYEVHSEPLVKKNVVEGRVWSYKDITVRKRIEKELSESEERYRRLVELSPDAIYMSVDGVNIFSNIAGAKLLGVDDPKELIGKPILGYVYYDYYDSSNKKLRSINGDKTVLPLIEEKLIKKDGGIVDIEVASTSFEYKGKTAILSVVRDVSERKRTEELKKKMEENSKLLMEAIEYDKLKTEFFANISYEFRTPLNIILGAQQLFDYVLKDIVDGENKQKIEKYLKIMKQNCYRLLRLVNNLIDITRIDAGFFNIQLKNRDIVNIVEEITLSVAEYIENKGIHLLFDTDVEEKLMACDADKIERIMLNLLSNATKFTEPGDSIEVTIEDKGDRVAISVRDTGIGIPADKQQIIFERFRQVDKSFIRNHEGSGIGLSIVKSLVELHKGDIKLESEWGEGSKFIIELPVLVLPDELEAEIVDNTYQSKIERINVEFSDIYL
ncbi:MAG: PAS domain-containing sensor histidine kinase [Bacillota bacterium]